MRCGGRGGYTDIDWSCHRIINNKAHETSPLWQRPNMMTHMQRIPALFFILPGSKWKYICPPLFFNVQIKMSNPSHYRPAGNHGKLNSARAQWAGPGGCLWVQQGTHGEVDQTHLWQTCRRGNWSVCQHRRCILTGAQITTSIYDQLSVWTRKTMSNGAFDAISEYRLF